MMAWCQVMLPTHLSDVTSDLSTGIPGVSTFRLHHVHTDDVALTPDMNFTQVPAPSSVPIHLLYHRHVHLAYIHRPAASSQCQA